METIYIVCDVRTVSGGGAVLITTTQHLSRESAESVFYNKLSAAANPDNQYPKHSVTLMTNDGFIIETKGYVHSQESEESNEN